MSHILIVDDSPTEVHVFQNILEHNGYSVETASDGETGIRMARENRPDLILMDIVMPGINGFQATRKLHRDEKTADIPIVIVTTKDQETDRIWGLRQGARGYIVKPVSEKELVECVESALADE
ncbi:MAG TPA: two-component system response regulator [Gammaproteobacteria bacterium]|jgi:twitching motility two-component system response regulator PilH|nr:two-component system response regulator [Gammaproteobacteria bacterium]